MNARVIEPLFEIGADDLLERRWFAAHRTAEGLGVQCEMLREVKELAEANWRACLSRLADMEALRDALAHEYTSHLQQGDPQVQWRSQDEPRSAA